MVATDVTTHPVPKEIARNRRTLDGAMDWVSRVGCGGFWSTVARFLEMARSLHGLLIGQGRSSSRQDWQREWFYRVFDSPARTRAQGYIRC